MARLSRFATLERKIIIGLARDAGVWPAGLRVLFGISAQSLRAIYGEWQENRAAILAEYDARKPRETADPSRTNPAKQASREALRATRRRQNAIADLECAADRRAGRPAAAEYPPRAEMTAKAWQEELTQIADALDPPTD